MVTGPSNEYQPDFPDSDLAAFNACRIAIGITQAIHNGGSPVAFERNTPNSLGAFLLNDTRKSTGMSLAPGGL